MRNLREKVKGDAMYKTYVGAYSLDNSVVVTPCNIRRPKMTPDLSKERNIITLGGQETIFSMNEDPYDLHERFVLQKFFE